MWLLVLLAVMFVVNLFCWVKGMADFNLPLFACSAVGMLMSATGAIVALVMLYIN